MSMAGNPMTGLMARYLGDRVSKKKKATAAPQAIGTPVDETAYGAMPQVNPMAKLAAAAAAGAAGGAVAAPLATQDPAAEEAMRREVMRQVEQSRVAALMDSDKALRMRRAELAQLNRAGVRGPEVAAAYADINKLDNDYNQSRTRLTELRNLSRRTAYDQGEQAFNAGQNRLLEDYRAGGAPVAGETVGPLQAGREFFRPRQFNDPEIVARRAELEREKAIGQASPTLDLEMRAAREGLAGQRAVQDRLVAQRGTYEQDTQAMPALAAGELGAKLQRASYAPKLAGLASQADEAGYQSDISAANLATEENTAKQKYVGAKMRTEAISAGQQEALAKAGTDPEMLMTLASQMNQKLSDIDNLDNPASFVQDYMDSIVSPLKVLASQGPEGKLLAARIARSIRNQPEAPKRSMAEAVASAGMGAASFPAAYLRQKNSVARHNFGKIKQALDEIAAQ